MTIDLSKIHPKIHSRYSPNLHKWLSAKTRGAASFLLERIKVYRHPNGTLYIGYKDEDPNWLMGSKLNAVLCNGSKADQWAYPGMECVVEVPDFWADYERIGRCAIDREHTSYFMNDNERWKVDRDHRECLWCGNHRQVLERKIRRTTIETWKPVPLTA